MRSSSYSAGVAVNPSVHMWPTLPAFIKSLPGNLGVDEVTFLIGKGVFLFPPWHVQTVLLNAFVEFVYPQMPVLDLPAFLQGVFGGDRGKPVSLFLYYAVLFAAIAFVEPEYVRQTIFADKIEARMTYFTRARVSFFLRDTLPRCRGS